MKYRLYLPLIAAVAAAVPTLAVAQTDARLISVEVADLDLRTAADQQRLDRRINSAARAVCATGMRGVSAKVQEQNCQKLALAKARAEADVAIARATGSDVRLAASWKAEPAS